MKSDSLEALLIAADLTEAEEQDVFRWHAEKEQGWATWKKLHLDGGFFVRWDAVVRKPVLNTRHTDVIKQKLQKIYKALATTDEKTVFTLKTLEKGINNLKSDLEEAKKKPVIKPDPRIDEITGIINELATRETPVIPDTKSLEKKLADLEDKFIQTITSIQENLAPDYKNEIDDLTKEIETLRGDILTRFANLGGGSANQKILVNGTWATQRYADINIVMSGAKFS